MKSLMIMYAQHGITPLFYENAASPGRRRHAAIQVVPLPNDIYPTAKGHFRQELLVADDQFSQHAPIIDTLAKVPTFGKMAFRKMMIKEMPYFHVWFGIDGGFGHIIENSGKWGDGERWPREVIGAGILGLDPTVWRKMGKWEGGKDPREDIFKKWWLPFDWTRMLTDAE